MYLQQFVYLLSCTADESVLFGNTLLYVWEDEESRSTVLSGNEGTVAEFAHKGLNGLHISFTLLDTTGNALAGVKERNYYIQ